MGDTVVKPPPQPLGKQQVCSVAAFSSSSSSLLNVFREMLDGGAKINNIVSNNSNSNRENTEPSLRSSMNFQDDRDSERNSSSPRGNSNISSQYTSFPFSPLESQATVEKSSFTFDDILLHAPSPLGEDSKQAKYEYDKASRIEALITKEIEALSDRERQQVENDIKGQSLSPSSKLTAPGLPSVPSVSQHQAIMDAELHKLFHMHPAYQELIPSLEYDYVKDSQLRLKMLVAENYNSVQAALRLAKFLKLLKETFGPFLLARPIQLVDLTAEERQLQRRGLQQLFRFRDHVGRRIVACFDSHYPPTTSIHSQLRVALYLIQAAADDEVTQKHGIVLLFMLLKELPVHLSSGTANARETSSTSRWGTMAAILNRIFDCAPIRIGAMHICSLSDHDTEEAKRDLVNGFGPKERVRCKFHIGSSMEISMALNSYGIPTDRLPLKYDGTVKVDDHLQWIAVREAKEEAFRQGRVFEAVECPMNMDILAGRGQLVRSHPGNVSFRQEFIQARSAKYNAAHSRDEKNEIASDILNDIAAESRRFLKQHPSGYWTELDQKVAKEKVMMAFREYRKSQKLESSQSSVPSAAPQLPSHLMQMPSPIPSPMPSPMPMAILSPYPYPHQHHYGPYPSYPPYLSSPHFPTSSQYPTRSNSSRDSPPSDEPDRKRYKTGHE
ncbi:hypothetical protein IV203_027297 [Nitzschia inconspicua]|uniref:DUF6824 domain-containing protein n=1 Tax=Nitzschia inconspicua TaxID=303405 RepID=A0A9K3Q3I6_9STRA|nr:hypothetical protein IV203_027297 [Nitzschia inconspicua]